MHSGHDPVGSVLAVCVGTTHAADWAGRLGRTAIDKRTATRPVEVTEAGLVGDEQADREHHGGPDQALYAYARQDADHWVAELGRDLPPGSFGENLRITGPDASQAWIGERWRIGDDVEVQVTGPRIPCSVFAGFLDVPDLVPRFLAAGRPGAYLRVLTPGSVAAGDPVRVVGRPEHGLTVADVLRIHTRDRHEAHRLLEADALAARLRSWAQERAEPRRA